MATTYVSSQHPKYIELVDDWVVCRDVYRGEHQVKSKRTVYLPATSGMVQDGMDSPGQRGYQAYQAYLLRAVFHDFMADAVETAIGIITSKAATIEVPAALEGMLKNATVDGESLQALLARINEQQLVTGRVGLLLDLPAVADTTNPLPYIALYNAETIVNWDDGKRDEVQARARLNLVVLDESSYERQSNFSWAMTDRYRILSLGDPTLVQSIDGDVQGPVPGQPADYYYAVVETDKGQSELTSESFKLVTVRGGAVQEIPFVFINSKDVIADPDDPPLLGLAKLALAAYRGEADYRQALFQQAQDTLVITGADKEDQRVGAGAIINLRTGGDAKYIGISADGLSEQREALNNDKMEAAHRAGQLIDARSRPFESGEALQTRMAAQTATLTQIVLAGAKGLENILRTAAVWVGANPDEVKVVPNLDFKLEGVISKELIELMSAKVLGAPISLKSIHAVAQERGLTRLDFEQELAEIASEEARGLRGTGTEEEDEPEDDPAEE